MPLLCVIASSSNADDEMYHTAPRVKCMLVLSFILFLNIYQKYLPLCDVVSVSLWQRFSPEMLSSLFMSSACIFKRMHCFYFFITEKNGLPPRVIFGASLRILFLSY